METIVSKYIPICHWGTCIEKSHISAEGLEHGAVIHSSGLPYDDAKGFLELHLEERHGITHAVSVDGETGVSFEPYGVLFEITQ